MASDRDGARAGACSKDPCLLVKKTHARCDRADWWCGLEISIFLYKIFEKLNSLFILNLMANDNHKKNCTLGPKNLLRAAKNYDIEA